MTKRAAVYTRTCAGEVFAGRAQIDHLRQVAGGLGWATVMAHGDYGGPDGRRQKGLDAVRRAVAAGDVNVVMLPSLTVIGATVEQVVSFIVELRAAGGVSLFVDDAGINTTVSDEMGLFEIASLLDTYRRSIKRRRILEGQARAKAAGIKFGRPRISDDKTQRVREALEAGNGIRASGRVTGVSAAAVLRIQRQMTSGHVPTEKAAP